MKRKQISSVEYKWTFKTVGLALLQGNAVGYAENPAVWIADTNRLATKLLMAADLYAIGREEEDGKRDAGRDS